MRACTYPTATAAPVIATHHPCLRRFLPRRRGFLRAAPLSSAIMLGMDSDPKPSTTEPRPRQITLRMIFGAIACFAVALVGGCIRTGGDQFVFVFLAAAAASVVIILIMTKGAAARGTAFGLGIGCVLAVILGLRFAVPTGSAIPLFQLFIVVIAAWTCAALGAAERGHRFTAWVAIIALGLFIVLSVTSQ